MHLCMASSIRAMPEKEKPPAMRVDLYLLHIKYNNANKIKNTLYIQDEIGYNTNKADSSNDIESK